MSGLSAWTGLIFLAAGVTALVGSAAAEGEPVAEGPAYGGERITAMGAEASNLIPFMAGDSASSRVGGLIHTTLLRYNGDLELAGEAAESWEVTDGGKTITFRLREDARFSDGEPLTSEDVAFTWRTVVDPETQTPYGSDYKRVSEVETPDPHTFVVHYDEPYAPALSTWASLAIMPAHILADQDINDTPFARDPVGAGPYKLHRWQAGQSIDLTRHEGWFRRRAYIDKVTFRVIPDKTTQFLELTAGNIDQMSPAPATFLRTFPERPDLRERIATYKYLGNNYTYLGFNLRREPFTDRRVRRAIAHAIDREELIKGVMLGQARRIAAPYKPGTRWYPDGIAPYAYDPDKARALLAEAGWTDSDGDGVRDKGGKRLSFEIITNNDNKQRKIAATLIQRRLKKVGIEVDLRLVEWATFISQFINPQDFDAVILGWSLSPDPDQYSIWHSSQQDPGEFNFVGLEDPDVDRLLEAGLKTFDAAERERIYHDFARELLEATPIVYLYAPLSLAAVHKRIRGIEPAPAGIEYNVEDWYIPQRLQRDALKP
ncbi:peptide-binding protein [Thiohalorhabdus sp.]|uniref:peptide-binding protein n=1 Tax=Thiohalorhabdus sp. TaxID=3094134 RepID=UPI002FC3713F